MGVTVLPALLVWQTSWLLPLSLPGENQVGFLPASEPDNYTLFQKALSEHQLGNAPFLKLGHTLDVILEVESESLILCLIYISHNYSSEFSLYFM